MKQEECSCEKAPAPGCTGDKEGKGEIRQSRPLFEPGLLNVGGGVFQKEFETSGRRKYILTRLLMSRLILMF